MSDSFLARISILNIAGISIWLSTIREVKTINTSLILCSDVTIWDTKFGTPCSVVIYGDPSPELLENAKAGGMDVKIFTLLQGL